MRWKRGSSSRDVIDLRGRGGRGGGGRGMAVPVGGGLGLAGVIVVLLLQVLGGGGAFEVPAGFDDQVTAPGGQALPAGQDPDRDLRDFSVYVFNDAQDTWEQTFRAQGGSYERAKLV